MGKALHVGAILLVLGMTACDTLEESTARGQNSLQRNYNTSRQRIAKWIYDEDKNRLPEKPVVLPRYCYKVMMDTLCYSQPSPTLRNQLVNYQGEGAPPPYAIQPQYVATDMSTQSTTVTGSEIQSTDLPPPVATTSSSHNGAPTTLMHGF